MENIGKRIAELLKKKGITAYELSDVTGISQATLSRIVNKNTKPNIRNSEILSEYFNVPKEWILNGTGEMEGEKKENPSPEGKGFDVYKENEILKKQNELNSQTITELLKTVGELLKTLNKQ